MKKQPNRPSQYVGVTGFMSETQVKEALTLPADLSPDLIMIGVLASSATITGMPARNPKRYPDVHCIEGIFQSDPRALNLIHFNTKEPSALFNQMIGARQAGGKFCHGFQLNIPWPDPDVIRRYIDVIGDQDVIVLQCGRLALNAVEYNARSLADKVSEYKDLVDYILIDPSGGLGQPFIPDFMNVCLSELYSTDLDMNYGIAGGLSSDTLRDLLEPVLAKFPDVSIDAEGKLRTPEDYLDIGLMRKYLIKAHRLMKKYPVKR